MSKGKIIVFEGLDSSFKATNSRMLKDYCEMLGKKVKLFSFPIYKSESSFFVRQYLAGVYGKEPKDVGPDLGSIFYMIDMFHTWKTEIEPLYNEGYIIIMDRFWQSNLYHQLGKVFTDPASYELPQTQEAIQGCVTGLMAMATTMFKLPIPDHTFLMKMNYNIIIELLKRKNSVDDIHESKKDYLRGVYNFFALFTDNNTSTEIFCDAIFNTSGNDITDFIRPREAIFADIVKVITDKKILEETVETKPTMSIEEFNKAVDAAPLEDMSDTELADLFGSIIGGDAVPINTPHIGHKQTKPKVIKLNRK